MAVVTGGGTGVGAATAEQLARSGWNVVIGFSRSASEANETARVCQARGVDAFAVQADVAIDADCRRLAAAAEARFGRIDALVNSAGITRFCRLNDLEGLAAEDFATVYAVNVIGAFQMARACAPLLQRSSAASIVNVSSQAALSGVGSSAAYCASKGALNTLTLSLARALAPTVRVNALCPGFVNTRWLRRGLDEAAYARVRQEVAGAALLGRMTEPEDVAAMAVFLVNSEVPITGELIGIDAGNHLRVATPRLDASP